MPNDCYQLPILCLISHDYKLSASTNKQYLRKENMIIGSTNVHIANCYKKTKSATFCQFSKDLPLISVGRGKQTRTSELHGKWDKNGVNRHDNEKKSTPKTVTIIITPTLCGHSRRSAVNMMNTSKCIRDKNLTKLHHKRALSLHSWYLCVNPFHLARRRQQLSIMYTDITNLLTLYVLLGLRRLIYHLFQKSLLTMLKWNVCDPNI